MGARFVNSQQYRAVYLPSTATCVINLNLWLDLIIKLMSVQQITWVQIVFFQEINKRFINEIHYTIAYPRTDQAHCANMKSYVQTLQSTGKYFHMVRLSCGLPEIYMGIHVVDFSTWKHSVSIKYTVDKLLDRLKNVAPDNTYVGTSSCLGEWLPHQS